MRIGMVYMSKRQQPRLDENVFKYKCILIQNYFLCFIYNIYLQINFDGDLFSLICSTHKINEIKSPSKISAFTVYNPS